MTTRRRDVGAQNDRSKHPKLPPKIMTEKPSKSEKVKMLLLPAVCVIAIFFSYHNNIWMMDRVKTPLDEPKIIDNASYTAPENLDRLWGSYRSNLYFGLKTRSENPLNVGMMWFNQFSRSFQMRFVNLMIN